MDPTARMDPDCQICSIPDENGDKKNVLLYSCATDENQDTQNRQSQGSILQILLSLDHQSPLLHFPFISSTHTHRTEQNRAELRKKKKRETNFAFAFAFAMGEMDVIVWWFLVLLAAGIGGGEAEAAAAVAVRDKPPCKFPALYNFGDSNSDTGGNSAAFQPIPWPYGQTFFKKPLGRDSDGRLLIDFIAEQLGLPYLSAYLNSLGANFSHGANFAFGGSTIRRQNETIFENGISPFSLDVQLWHYDQFKSRTRDLYTHAKSAFEKSMLPRPEDFSTALYTFDIGQNDLSVAYRKMNDDQLRVAMPDIIAQFSTAIQHLYEQGARSFWVHNTGPVGCLPATVMWITQPKPGELDENGCKKDQNSKAIEFNKQLKDAVVKLRTRLPQAAITYVDLFAAKYGLISKAKSQGWADPVKICCGYHENDGHVWCGQKGVTYNGTTMFGAACSNPELYVSWDGVHHTEAANHWFANQILNGSRSDPPVPITHACYRD